MGQKNSILYTIDHKAMKVLATPTIRTPYWDKISH